VGIDGTWDSEPVRDLRWVLHGQHDDIAPVGYTSLGAAYWGQFDLAGEVFEWNLDGYNGTYADPCLDCAYLPTTAASGR